MCRTKLAQSYQRHTKQNQKSRFHQHMSMTQLEVGNEVPACDSNTIYFSELFISHYIRELHKDLSEVQPTSFNGITTQAIVT